MSLSEKAPAEIVPITFEFRNLTTAPTAPVVTITQTDGPPDASVASMLVGSAQVIGTQVRHKVGGGQNGCTYELVCQIDTAEGYRFVVAGELPVRLP